MLIVILVAEFAQINSNFIEFPLFVKMTPSSFLIPASAKFSKKRLKYFQIHLTGFAFNKVPDRLFLSDHSWKDFFSVAFIELGSTL